MKNRKLSAVILVLLLSFCLFAEGSGEDGAYSGVTTNAFRPVLWDDHSLTYALYGNPAVLTQKGMIIELPSVSATVYNLAAAAKTDAGAEALSNILKFKATTGDYAALMQEIIRHSASGINKIGSVDAGLGFSMKNFAFGADAQAFVHTMPKIGSSGNQSLLNTGVVPEVNVGFSAATAFRLAEGKSTFFDAGVSVHFVTRMYFEQIVAQDILDDNFALDNIKAHASWAVPFDIGFTYGMADGLIKASAVAANINGYYYTRVYDNYKDALNKENGGEEYKAYTPWDLELSLVIDPDWKTVDPKLTLKASGLRDYYDRDIEKSEALKELVKHLTAELDLRIAETVKLSGAFKNGYLEFGAGLSFSGNTIEVRYGYSEMGENYGAKPVDGLTVRCRLGFFGYNKY